MIDLGAIRGSGTAILLLSFVGLWAWAWSPRRQRAFDEAARLPFLDEATDVDAARAAATPRDAAGRVPA